MLIQRGNVDATIGVTPSTVTVNQNLDLTKVDALVGARYSLPLSDRLTALTHAAVSAGSTSYIWSTSAGIAYALSRSGKYTVTAGYGWMDIKLSGGNSMDAKVTLSEIASGVSMRF